MWWWQVDVMHVIICNHRGRIMTSVRKRLMTVAVRQRQTGARTSYKDCKKGCWQFLADTYSQSTVPMSVDPCCQGELSSAGLQAPPSSWQGKGHFLLHLLENSQPRGSSSTLGFPSAQTQSKHTVTWWRTWVPCYFYGTYLSMSSHSVLDKASAVIIFELRAWFSPVYRSTGAEPTRRMSRCQGRISKTPTRLRCEVLSSICVHYLAHSVSLVLQETAGDALDSTLEMLQPLTCKPVVRCCFMPHKKKQEDLRQPYSPCGRLDGR